MQEASFDHFFAVLQASLASRNRTALSGAVSHSKASFTCRATEFLRIVLKVCIEPASETESRRLYSLICSSRESSVESRNKKTKVEIGQSMLPGQANERKDVAMRQGTFDTPSASIPTVSMKSLQRASRTVEDFCKTYLMFFDCAWQDIFFQVRGAARRADRKMAICICHRAAYQMTGNRIQTRIQGITH